MQRNIEFQLSRNLRRIGHLDIPGGGQIVVDGDTAYIGHMKPPHGTSILDVSDPTKPRLVASIDSPSPHSHTHKVRVVGDLMFTNVEPPEPAYTARKPVFDLAFHRLTILCRVLRQSNRIGSRIERANSTHSTLPILDENSTMMSPSDFLRARRK